MNEREGTEGAWEIRALPQEGKLGIAFPLYSRDALAYRADDDCQHYALSSDQVHALISELNRALLVLERERDRQADEQRQGIIPF
ncbi:hypothetical protein [Pararobbsia alpina]|uniref:Uncharacterized protein n=1 Tax=Pararobbsia alpina TaxID=621374 RepID=A0A6S7C0U6_9BURK|nr:hypothetical protein [Pararobbsia alpina]CAB3778650.1 hypothetical protein LMG28138_00542 [Pararobbsia alpina]